MGNYVSLCSRKHCVHILYWWYEACFLGQSFWTARKVIDKYLSNESTFWTYSGIYLWGNKSTKILNTNCHQKVLLTRRSMVRMYLKETISFYHCEELILGSFFDATIALKTNSCTKKPFWETNPEIMRNYKIAAPYVKTIFQALYWMVLFMNNFCTFIQILYCTLRKQGDKSPHSSSHEHFWVDRERKACLCDLVAPRQERAMPTQEVCLSFQFADHSKGHRNELFFFKRRRRINLPKIKRGRRLEDAFFR